jgi:signal peptidase complex subunit 3
VPLTAQNLLGYIFDRSFVPASLRNQLFPGARSKSKRNARRNKSAVGSQIKEREARIIKLKNEKPKYHITDFSGHLAERGNVTLEVGWNVQPWVGALTWTISEGKKLGLWNGFIGGRSEAFDLPSLKGKKTSNSAAQATPASAGAVPIL